MKSVKEYVSFLMVIFFLFSSAKASAETYFVDSSKGNDGNSGTEEMEAWQTLEAVNTAQFKPGDKILFKRGMRWRGKLTVPKSGSKNHPITFRAYGRGENPVIMRTVKFSDWKPLENSKKMEEKARVWVGRIPGLNNSWGMVKKGQRTPIHIRKQNSGWGVATMADGYFYSPVNSGSFYYRNDSGFPGVVEIGAYDEAIHIENKSYIIIDSINTFGPGGKQAGSSGTAKGLNYKSVAISGGSSHISIRNLSISHANSKGISAHPSTSKILYDNLVVSHNGGTGIYLNSNGGRIVNCRSFDNGRLADDIGDRGGIGSFKGQNIVIEQNEVFRNGPDDGGADFDVSLVLTGAVKIQRNYIHDCLQGCLQVAAGGDNSVIAYNVISGYGTAKGKMSSSGKFSGIRIGGGGKGSKNVHIYNNVLHGGKAGKYTSEAAIFIGPFDNSGLQIINNIFAGNDNKHIFVASGKNTMLGGMLCTNNLFSSLKSGVYWKGRKINTLKALQVFTNLGGNALVVDPLFSNASGRFNEVYDFKLQQNSPAKNRGVYLDITGDYNNKVVPNGASTDIGAFEAS